MKFPLFFTILFLLVATVMVGEAIPMPLSFDIKASERFAKLALACVHKEFPNHVSHTLNSDADVAASAKIDSCFLRLLRLAFLGARTLAVGTADQDFP